VRMTNRLVSVVGRKTVLMTVVSLVMLALLGAAAVARAGRPADDDAGKKVFESNCIACHGPDGSGTPTGQSLMAPDLRSDAVQKLSDDDLKKQVLEGKNNMPPFKDVLSAADVQAVVAYVRTFAKKN
jgi:mono/diheme cytochrome c family protein